MSVRSTALPKALAAVLVALSLWGQYAWTTELLVLDPPSDYPP